MGRIGIIGGSGLDNPDMLQNPNDKHAVTPYGSPSSPIKLGTIEGQEVALLARHGRQHTVPPTQVNFRANLWALKEAGCDCIVATTAVGSLREEMCRGDMVVVDQFIDFTRHRPVTFHDTFAAGQPVHTPMADPFNAELSQRLTESCKALKLRNHARGTVITIEGPRFSTRAESHMFRAWGADIINMSIAPECALANELGIPYAAVAMVTDYDCWKTDEEPVSWEAIKKFFVGNVEKVQQLLLNAIPRIADATS